MWFQWIHILQVKGIWLQSYKLAQIHALGLMMYIFINWSCMTKLGTSLLLLIKDWLIDLHFCLDLKPCQFKDQILLLMQEPNFKFIFLEPFLTNLHPFILCLSFRVIMHTLLMVKNIHTIQIQLTHLSIFSKL